jgi:hypothetical protein
LACSITTYAPLANIQESRRGCNVVKYAHRGKAQNEKLRPNRKDYCDFNKAARLHGVVGRDAALAKIQDNLALRKLSLDDIAARGPPDTGFIICIDVIY